MNVDFSHLPEYIKDFLKEIQTPLFGAWFKVYHWS